MNTLFDLVPEEIPEIVITRYVVTVTDLEDGSVSYYHHHYIRDEYSNPTQFIEIDEPIKTRGMKLPKLYKSYTQARNRVTDLYGRHKYDGDGIRIGVEVWTRKPDASEWTRGAS